VAKAKKDRRATSRKLSARKTHTPAKARAAMKAKVSLKARVAKKYRRPKAGAAMPRQRSSLLARRETTENAFWRMNALISAEVKRIEQMSAEDEIRKPTLNMQQGAHVKIGSELRELEQGIREGTIAMPRRKQDLE